MAKKKSGSAEPAKGSFMLGDFITATEGDVEAGPRAVHSQEPHCDAALYDQDCFAPTFCYCFPILGFIKGILCLPFSILIHLVIFFDALVMMPYDLWVRCRVLILTHWFSVPLKVSVFLFIIIGTIIYPFLLLVVVILYSLIFPFTRAMIYQFWRGVPCFAGGVAHTIRDCVENVQIYHIIHRANVDGLEYYVETEPEEQWSILRLLGITRDLCSSFVEVLVLPLYLIEFILFIPVGIVGVGIPCFFIGLAKFPFYVVYGWVIISNFLWEGLVHNVFTFCCCFICFLPVLFLGYGLWVVMAIVSLVAYYLLQLVHGFMIGSYAVQHDGDIRAPFTAVLGYIVVFNEETNLAIGGTRQSWVPQWLPTCCRECSCSGACSAGATGRVQRARSAREKTLGDMAEERLYATVWESFFSQTERLGIRTIQNKFLAVEDVKKLPAWLFIGLPALTTVQAALRSRNRGGVVLADGRVVTDSVAPKKGRPALVYKTTRELTTHMEAIDLKPAEIDYITQCVLFRGNDAAPGKTDRVRMKLDVDSARMKEIDLCVDLAQKVSLIGCTMPQFDETYQVALNKLINTDAKENKGEDAKRARAAARKAPLKPLSDRYLAHYAEVAGFWRRYAFEKGIVPEEGTQAGNYSAARSSDAGAGSSGSSGSTKSARSEPRLGSSAGSSSS